MPRRAERKHAGDTGRHRAKRGQARSLGTQPLPRGRCETQRQRLAYESARILSEQGGVEFDRARRKAAERLGISDKRCWPDNEEIQSALLQQQRLFHDDERQRTLDDLRRHALSAMREFSAFEPRLVGQALDGTANREQGVELLLFAENPEDVALDLLNRGIPWQQRDEQFRYAGGEHLSHPVFRFMAGGIPLHLIVLPQHARRNPPLSPVSERPERGIGAAELGRLVAAEP
ncbi:MAG: hypothetical protein WBM40_21195 [Thiohalocapsa sp.]